MFVVGESKRWFYPISAFFITAFALSTGLWTMFYPNIIKVFEIAPDKTAPVFLASLFTGLGSMIMGPPIAGFIFDKKGPKVPALLAGFGIILGMFILSTMLKQPTWAAARPLWYLGSFFVGFGGGLWGGTYTTTVARWFPDKIGTAMGLAVAGGGTGIIIMSPLAGYIIRSVGFSSTIFAVLGAMAFVMLVGVGFLFYGVPATDWKPKGWVPPVSKNTGLETVEKHFTLAEAVRDVRFWILYGGFLCSAFAFMLFAQNASMILVEGLTKGGLTSEEVVGNVVPTYLAFVAGVGFLGRFGWGWLMDKLGSPFKTLPLVYFSSGVMIWVFFMGYTSLTAVMISAAILYFAFGGEPTVHYAAVPAIFGRKHIGKIMTSLNAFSVGIGIAAGPYVGAAIKDYTGGYYWAIVLAVVLRMMATGFSLTGFFVTKKLDAAEKAEADAIRASSKAS
ncbi:MAG: MFS transporter [Firmicutes bacterium]|nr:MFS transporter [Bacillota bacterium]